MTREEEIKQAGIEYTCKNRPVCICGDAFSEMADELNRNRAFEEGAKWADSNPQKGLVSIDKVRKWLKLNTNWDDEWDEMGRNSDYGKIEELCKAMED